MEHDFKGLVAKMATGGFTPPMLVLQEWDDMIHLEEIYMESK